MTKKSKRPDSDYEIEAVTKTFKVLECLGGENFKPKKIAEIMEKTKIKPNSIDRILKNLRLRGYAVQNEKGEWLIGGKLLRFASDYSEFCLNAISQK